MGHNKISNLSLWHFKKWKLQNLEKLILKLECNAFIYILISVTYLCKYVICIYYINYDMCRLFMVKININFKLYTI